MRLPDIVRLILAAIFFIGAIANTAMAIFAPSVYESFADMAFVPAYRDWWHELVYPNIHLFLIPVILLELAIAWLLLRSGVYVKYGLLIALLFDLFLVPFWWQGGAIANLLLALPLAWLLRYPYPLTILAILRGAGA
jgi:hypothetical protein